MRDLKPEDAEEELKEAYRYAKQVAEKWTGRVAIPDQEGDDLFASVPLECGKYEQPIHDGNCYFRVMYATMIHKGTEEVYIRIFDREAISQLALLEIEQHGVEI